MSGGAASLALLGGTVHTLADGERPATALAVAGDRVLAAGSDADVRALIGPGTEVVALDGATVIPGFVDTHNHQLETGVNLRRLQLDRCGDLAGLLAALAAEAAARPAGSWIAGSARWHESRLRERRLPDRHELDAVAPGHPVLLPRGGHVAVANTRALDLAGIALDAPDPPGGRCERDGEGRLTGRLFEAGAIDLVRAHIPPPTRGELCDGIATAMAAYAAEGITSVRDPWLSQAEGEAYLALRAAGGMRVRTSMLRYVEPNASPAAVGELLAWAREAVAGDELLRFGGLKLVLDGGIETAALRAPHAGTDGDLGELLWEDGALREALAAAARAGASVGIHVAGDRALDQVLEAVGAVARSHDLRPLRWCLEHVFLANERQIARIGELGLAVSFHLPLLHELAPAIVQRWGEERAQRCLPLRDLAAAGVRTAAGSDSDVGRFRPLDAIAWSVDRATSLGRPLGTAQALDPRAALRAYTADGPYLTFEEARKGTLAPGRLADFALLDGDPLAPGRAIGALGVRATYLGGCRVHPPAQTTQTGRSRWQ